MQLSEARALREDRKALIVQAQRLLDMPKPDLQAFDRMMRDADAMKVKIDALEAPSIVEFRGGQPGGYETRLERAERTGRDTAENSAHSKAFRSYLRHGLSEMDIDGRRLLEAGYRAEYRDMGVGVGGGAYPSSVGGFFVPVGFVNQIVTALKYTGPMMDGDVVTMVDSATGQPLPWPAADDVDTVGERVAEGSQVTTADVGISQIMLGAWMYSTKLVKVSLQLQQDSAFNMEQFLVQTFAERLGRILNSDFTTGLGSASQQPYGLATACLAHGNLVAAVGSSVNDGTNAGTNSVGTDDFSNLEHAVNRAYRRGASYMMADSTLKSVQKVKDRYGRPIFVASTVAGEPDTVNGYPMLVNEYLDPLQVGATSPPATKNTIIFGDLKRYAVRRVRDLSVLVLRERFADYFQLGYLGFARFDGQPLYAGSSTPFPFSMLQNIY